jgi:hypothetical protein
MSSSPIPIPYEKQADAKTHRGCGAACLSMVYKSYGKDVQQADIWPEISKPNRFGSVASTTHLMALHAIGQGLNAVIIQARHPLQVLRICRDAGIRAILNHRGGPDVSTGHFTVLVDIDDRAVVLHDPASGPARRVPHAELMGLWQPQSSRSEITGNILIGIADNPAPLPACEFCHAAIPPKMDCPRCKKAVGLSPAAVLGCIRDGCIARMWNFVACPHCDVLFNETGKSTAEMPKPAAAATGTVIAPPDLEKAFAQLDKFCAHLMAIPGVEKHPDLKAQIDFIQASKEPLKLAQAEEIGAIQVRMNAMAAAAEESKKRLEEQRKKQEEAKAPPPPLDGDALGKAFLKNLGFK